MIKDLWAKMSYYWFLGMLIIIGLICGAFNVDAATITTSSDQWATQWCSDRSCDYTQAGSTYFRDYANVNSGAYTNSNSYYLTAIRLRQQFNSSNYLQTGTQYQLRYKLWFNPKYKLSYYDMRQEDIDFVVTDTGNNQVTLDNSMFTCSYSNIENQDSFFLTCFYTPTSTIKQVYLRLKMPFDRYVSYSSYTGYIFKSINTINYTSSSITYNTGTQDAIQNQTTIITNQTNEINNSINNAIENQNQNTQDIINNNNTNTQQTINSQKVCSNYDKSSVVNTGVYLRSNSSTASSNAWGVTDYISIDSNSDITTIKLNSSDAHLCFYNINKTYISCIENSTLTLNNSLIIPSGTSYVRFSIRILTDEPQFTICRNGNQALDDTLKDDSIDAPNEMIEDFEDMLPQNGVITNLIGLPITLYTKILDNVNGTCSAFNLGSLYEHDIIFPCINISQYLGNVVWTSIDLIISGAFVIIISKKMVKVFYNFTALKDGDVISD